MAENKLIIDLILNDKDALRKLDKSLKQIDSTTKSSTNNASLAWAKFASQVFIAEKAVRALNATVGRFSSSVVTTATKFESLKTQIRGLVDSTEEANAVFKQFTEFSAKTPFQVDEVVSAGKQLLVVKDQIGDMNKALTATANIASFAGISMDKAGEQFVRVFSSGAGSADIFREKAVRSLTESKVGFDLTTVSADKAGQAIIDAFTSGDLGQSTQRLSRTFEGLSSTIRDNFTLALNDIAEGGYFDSLKADAGAFLKTFTAIREESETYKQVVEGLSASFTEFKDSAISGLKNVALLTAVVFDNFNKISNAIGGFATMIPALQAIGGLGKGVSLATQAIIGDEAEAGSLEEKVRNTFAMFEQALEEQKQILKESDTLVAEATGTTDEAQEIDFTKFIEGEQKKIQAMREMWTAWNDEKASMDLIKYQQEAEQYQFMIDTMQKANQSMWKLAGTLRDQFATGVSSMISQAIRGTIDWKDAFKELGFSMVDSLIKFGVQLVINKALATALQSAFVASSVGTASALASAWSAPALLVSLATFGANSAGAIAGIASTASALASASLLGGISGLEEGGTTTTRGSVLVGEAGPEILNLPRGASVIPLDKTTGGGDTTINIELNNVSMNSRENVEELAMQISEFINNERRRA